MADAPAVTLKLCDERGAAIKERFAAAPLPTDLVPGEFVQLVDLSGNPQGWFVFWDKQRFWDGKQWTMTGSVTEFDPGSMTEPEIYAFRHKMLTLGGWI